uniref:Uncharacterized protein n=1 Tax=Pseudictyota dubia TaxID=2749911 RepID=A0A7R9ZIZ3_9STRA|eukprot:CAMPEP_0197433526 /NCGR_PEP_ID=MMETSP1175-20131217/1401_1 /TAXON_ID=1003142 /ORGANISM="Triceratium dubium, Strain CCMP147" /LENGTH=151 /DNA_ID=CAMNT_0042961941 /DNA_START=72 /DNA_END=527 /DNA_ORIENTATION=-
MKLLFAPSIFTALVLSAVRGQELRGTSRELTKRGRAGNLPTPHELHQYEQIKFQEEPLWKCRFEMGCVICKNPNPIGGQALLVEIKSQYKRADWNVPDDQSVREHCIMPQQEIAACTTSNIVIEPDTSFLPNGDRPSVSGNYLTCPEDPRY